MHLANDFKKSSYVFRSVHNGYHTTKALSSWRENGLRRIDLRFRDGSIIQEATLGSAWALISYYYWSHKLGSYDPNDLKDLGRVGQYIYKRLEESFDRWPKSGWGMQGTHGILYAVVRKFKPNHMLETGIANGYSATIILTAMKKNGTGALTSVDVTDLFEFNGKKQKVGWLVPDDLVSLWETKIGKTKDVLPDLSFEIDAFYHDSEHSEQNMLFEFDWADKHLKKQGILISDDIDLNNAWSIFMKNHRSYSQIVKSVSTGVSQKE